MNGLQCPEFGHLTPWVSYRIPDDDDAPAPLPMPPEPDEDD